MTNTRNTHNGNARAVARFGRGWIMRKAWAIFRTVGTRYAKPGVTTFADALRRAWAIARVDAVTPVSPPPAYLADLARRAARNVRRRDVNREWGRHSYRYDVSVMGR